MNSNLQAHWETIWSKKEARIFPWEIEHPDFNLVSWIGGQQHVQTVLEIGCGTGINSSWLAQQGYQATAIDISPSAIELAKIRANERDIVVDFQVDNILNSKLDQCYDFIFDRGCFHSLNLLEDQKKFVNAIEQKLNKNGRWLSLIGSTENVATLSTQHTVENVSANPPRRSITDIALAVEPYLQIQSIELSTMQTAGGHLASCWVMVAQKRKTPAVAWSKNAPVDQ